MRSYKGLICGLLLLSWQQSAVAKEIAHVFGWVEHARLVAMDVAMKAKLDSGALTSSLHATEIERFKRDGKNWVRFKVDLDQNGDGEIDERETFERPLFRNVRIRGAGGTVRRPVVLMRICLGNVIHEEQFSLEDRSRMLYPALLGRRTIQHLGLLDVTRTFMNEPMCDEDSEVRAHGSEASDPDIGDGAGHDDEEDED